MSQPIPETEAPLSTRERILNAAEGLFAARGYYGVTIREITKEAGVDVALASYYFGPKADLFREVLTRRIHQHRDDLMAVLSSTISAAGDKPPTVEDLVRAFVKPVFDKLSGGDEGWRNYIHLLAYLSNSQQQQEFTQPMNEVIDPYVRHLIAQFRRALPTASDRSIGLCYYMLQAAVINIFSETGGIERVTDGRCDSTRYDDMLEHMTAFFAAGFHRLASQ